MKVSNKLSEIAENLHDHDGLDEKPTIHVTTNLRGMVDQAIGAIVNHKSVYQRGLELIDVVSEGPVSKRARASLVDGVEIRVYDLDGLERDAESVSLRSIPTAVFRAVLGECAAWVRHDGRSGKWHIVVPPDNVVTAVQQWGTWPGARVLKYVSSTPLVRPDGTIFQEPGYDPETGVLYRPNIKFDPIEDAPTHQDAYFAMQVLKDVVCDFPFQEPKHRSVFVAAVLTMLARSAITGPVPAMAIDASTRGTGKSRLVDVATQIAHGIQASKMSMPRDDDEMRKRITSLVREGDPAVCLDNIVNAISLPSLDCLLTSSVWKDRELGSNTSIRAPNVAVYFFTGNNMTFGGDLSRRALHCRMQSPFENPEERSDFRHPDLLAFVRQNRTSIVHASLTMIRAWFAAGKPVASKFHRWGSFEEWSDLIANVIAWVGDPEVPDPMLARATQDEAIDPDVFYHRAILDGLRALDPNRHGITSKAIVTQLISYKEPERGENSMPAKPDPGGVLSCMIDAVEAVTKAQPGRPIDHTRLGYYLKSKLDRVLGEQRIVRVNGKEARNVLWSVM